MMRALIIISLIAVAGCSESGGEKKAAKAASLEAGQWETTREITSFRAADRAPRPAIKGAVGDKSTSTACIGKDEGARPPAALFVGEGYQCRYKDSYIRKGRMNATFSCTREGLQGDIQMAVDGTFTGTSFEGVVNSKSYLASDGDIEMATRISGRRSGECQPAAD